MGVRIDLMEVGPPEHPPTWDPSHHHHGSSLGGPGCRRPPHGSQRSRLWCGGGGGGGGRGSPSSHFKPGGQVLGAPPWSAETGRRGRRRPEWRLPLGMSPWEPSGAKGMFRSNLHPGGGHASMCTNIHPAEAVQFSVYIFPAIKMGAPETD